MKPSNYFFPLRFVLPIILLAFIFAINLYTLLFSLPLAQKQIEYEVENYFSETLNRTSSTARYMFQQGNKDAVVREISNLGGVEGYRLILLVDENSKIIASNRFDYLNQSLNSLFTKLKTIDQDRIKQILASGASFKTWTADRNLLVGYYPVTIGLSKESLRPDKVGFIFVEFDATLRKENAERLITNQSKQVSIFTTVLVVALYILLNYAITRRASRLVSVTKALSDGNLKIRSNLLGSDELAMIGTAFDSMAIRLEQKQEQLSNSENRLRSIFNNVLDGIVTINEQGEVESFNEAAERIFGYSKSEVIGRNVKMLMPEPYQSQHDEYLHAYRNTGLKKIIGIGREVVGRRKDGTQFPMDLAVSEMWLGNVRFFIGIVRDITDRKELERMKKEFVATVTHELRTPLTSIVGSLGLIAGGAAGELSDKANSLVDLAHRNSKRLVELINDILDMEKIESGRMTYNMQPTPLMPLVANSIDSTRGYFEEHGNYCVLVASVDYSIKVNVDEGRLGQVMANLLSNAAKFSPKECPVEVGVELRGESVRVWVRDQGPGISDEFRKRLFQKFSQEDSSNTRKKGGSGLGLSIVKAMIEHMHGSINLESVEGQGATFYFDLPVYLATTN